MKHKYSCDTSIESALVDAWIREVEDELEMKTPLGTASSIHINFTGEVYAVKGVYTFPYGSVMVERHTTIYFGLKRKKNHFVIKER